MGKEMDFECREYDIPRTEAIERYMQMSEEELDALIAKVREEARREWEQEKREREKGK